MSANKRPRKAYRPRPVTAETMKLAIYRAAKPPAADRADVLDMVRQAVKSLREGVATEHQWGIVSGAVSLALAIEQQGIVRGMLGHFKVAEQALQDIYDRATLKGARPWLRTTLYFNELDAIADLLTFHAYQWKQLGRAELIAAANKAQKNTASEGCIATVVRDLERLAA